MSGAASSLSSWLCRAARTAKKTAPQRKRGLLLDARVIVLVRSPVRTVNAEGAALLLANLAAHESPLVRTIALEWAPELGREAALLVAAKFQDDGDTSVRERAAAVLRSPLTGSLTC